MSKISISAKKVNRGLTADGHAFIQFVVRGSNPCCKNKPFYIGRTITESISASVVVDNLIPPHTKQR